jgi:hypothetical protein
VVLEPSGYGSEPFSFSVTDTKAILSYPNHSGRDKFLAAKVFQLCLEMGSPSQL